MDVDQDIFFSRDMFLKRHFELSVQYVYKNSLKFRIIIYIYHPKYVFETSKQTFSKVLLYLVPTFGKLLAQIFSKVQ